MKVEILSTKCKDKVCVQAKKIVRNIKGVSRVRVGFTIPPQLSSRLTEIRGYSRQLDGSYQTLRIVYLSHSFE